MIVSTERFLSCFGDYDCIICICIQNRGIIEEWYRGSNLSSLWVKWPGDGGFFYCIANCALRNKMFCMEFSGVIISPWIPSRIKFCFRLHAFRIRMLWYFQEWCQPWFCIKCWFSDNRICRFAESYYQCICLCWFYLYLCCRHGKMFIQVWMAAQLFRHWHPAMLWVLTGWQPFMACVCCCVWFLQVLQRFSVLSHVLRSRRFFQASNLHRSEAPLYLLLLSFCPWPFHWQDWRILSNTVMATVVISALSLLLFRSWQWEYIKTENTSKSTAIIRCSENKQQESIHLEYSVKQYSMK